jgi:hypothetical protein
MLTDWFPTLSGVKQGDSGSPTIFAYFINDLAEGLKTLNKGVQFNNDILCCLFYADDILLLSENEQDMQDMLDYVHEWCRKWRLIINIEKSKVVHFRNKGKNRSNFQFRIGDCFVLFTDMYKYLGVNLHEHLDFTQTAELLSKSGGRALGAIISKVHNYKDVGFKTFTKMYYSCVVPVTDYCSSIWGFKYYNKIDMTQNRAIRYFMGVHKFAPLLAINGDMAWISTQHRRWVNILRFWTRLVNLPYDRLPK